MDTSPSFDASIPPISPDAMNIDTHEVPPPALASGPVIPESVAPMGMSDVNMHQDTGNEVSLDLEREFRKLLELSEKQLMNDPSGVYREYISVLDGYEATAASHRSELHHLEGLLNDWGMGKGIPATYDKLSADRMLKEATHSMGEARDKLEQAEKQYKEFLNSVQVDCRSSALREVLQLTRDQMTTKGVGVVEAGKWKGLFHLAEDELREVDEQALCAFRLGVSNVEPPPKKKMKGTQKAKKGKGEKVGKVDDGDKKPTEALAVRERWIEMSPEEQAKLQDAAEAAIDRYLTSGTAIEPSLKRKIREIVDLAPRAGTTSRELSLYILERTYQICRHHRRYRTEDSFAKHDTVISIEGVGYRKDYTRRAAEGHLDCGCSIELALFDFFWFKTWSMGSSHPNVTIHEDLKCDTIPPRLRSFFAEAYKFIGMVTLDDLFALKWGTEGCHNRLRLLQIARMTEYLQLQGVSVPGFQGEQEYEVDAGVVAYAIFVLSKLKFVNSKIEGYGGHPPSRINFDRTVNIHC
ncbi:uncharacterized protein LACBIDRAFT_299171 [Laccaria bicolor S238N-H82]|uniref:Predicted protein n=1 Tax=Laccaria bicolor (strain S238N-H82 / ATCC MYA-4686) TaxID=486041 RepID=B0E3L5_LACBS|nr:uncharacterized protein LACBIDRAFT_299171 [Laccaria bicolor S238N-H82]EDQ98565.1 predicted protein [Laccaria bicolor S238N-H82]|eukprot:XP_001890784.1 predicted protein [Laccaria bicolor S238N-H82]